MPESAGIDTWNDADILAAFVGGQERAIAAVKVAIPQISHAANAIAACLAGGGRLFYAGAGTSIRIGVQDGSELPATFGMDEDKIDCLIAGGRAAMFDTRADKIVVMNRGRVEQTESRWNSITNPTISLLPVSSARRP